MSTEEVLNNLDDFVKIPTEQQRPEVIQIMRDRLKQIREIFFDKTKPAEERNAGFDEHNKIANYLGEKPLQWKIKEKGTGTAKRQRTTDEKKKDIDEMLNFALSKHREVLNSKSQAEKNAMTSEDQKQLQIIAGQVFNKACDNWISG